MKYTFFLTLFLTVFSAHAQMGSKYSAILNDLKSDPLIYDIEQGEKNNYTLYIFCKSKETPIAIDMYFFLRGRDTLCWQRILVCQLASLNSTISRFNKEFVKLPSSELKWKDYIKGENIEIKKDKEAYQVIISIPVEIK